MPKAIKNTSCTSSWGGWIVVMWYTKGLNTGKLQLGIVFAAKLCGYVSPVRSAWRWFYKNSLQSWIHIKTKRIYKISYFYANDNRSFTES